MRSTGPNSVPASQTDIQRSFIPEGQNVLLIPGIAIAHELHVKIPDHTSHNHAHLRIGETASQKLADVMQFEWCQGTNTSSQGNFGARTGTVARRP